MAQWTRLRVVSLEHHETALSFAEILPLHHRGAVIPNPLSGNFQLRVHLSDCVRDFFALITCLDSMPLSKRASSVQLLVHTEEDADALRLSWQVAGLQGQ